MRLRNSVRAARERRGITLTELARRTKLSRVTITAIERDSGYQPRARVMFRLATALNTDLGTLFWEEPEIATVAG